jgi:uncharacterized membrane protein YkgB
MARGALRVVLTLLGGGLLIASAFLDWLAFEDAPKGTEVPIEFLWSPAEREVPEFATSLGLVVIVLGLLAIVGLVPRTGWLTSLAGLLAIAVFVSSVVTLYRVGGEGADLGIGEVAIGGWLVLGGGLLALIGGLFGRRPARAH